MMCDRVAYQELLKENQELKQDIVKLKEYCNKIAVSNWKELLGE